MPDLVIAFERIGRHHNVPPPQTPLNHPDRVAEAIRRYAKEYLSSGDCDVDVRLPHGGILGSVILGRGRGRFGRGTIAIVSEGPRP